MKAPTRKLYASDSEDNHEEPWLQSDGSTPVDAAQLEAEDRNLGVGDHVYVIEASEAQDGGENPKENGWPLDVHRTWKFRVVKADDDGVVVEEVAK